MTLIPTQRLRSLEEMAGKNKEKKIISADLIVKSSQSPDVKLKMLREKKIRKTKLPKVKENKTISLEDSIQSNPLKTRPRGRAFIKHLKRYNNRMQYNQKTGEIQLDGIVSGDSDIRELMTSLSGEKKLDDSIQVVDTSKQALEATDAPATLYARWYNHPTIKKGDWGSM